ncbi:MAG: class I SAM-dependent methyltransferase, partial [Verrucomicrobiales bacterium]
MTQPSTSLPVPGESALASCPACVEAEWKELYRGKVRVGKFPNLSDQEVKVWRCAKCGVGYLPDAFCGYEDDRYRESVDGKGDIDAYHAAHDRLLSFHFNLVGADSIRDRVVADVGCGGGSFLDFCSNVAERTIAIEPSLSYRAGLETKGHLTFGSATDALDDWSGRVDLAVSFAVIEHVEDPVSFLHEVRELLRDDG